VLVLGRVLVPEPVREPERVPALVWARS